MSTSLLPIPTNWTSSLKSSPNKTILSDKDTKKHITKSKSNSFLNNLERSKSKSDLKTISNDVKDQKITSSINNNDPSTSSDTCVAGNSYCSCKITSSKSVQSTDSSYSRPPFSSIQTLKLKDQKAYQSKSSDSQRTEPNEGTMTIPFTNTTTTTTTSICHRGSVTSCPASTSNLSPHSTSFKSYTETPYRNGYRRFYNKSYDDREQSNRCLSQSPNRSTSGSNCDWNEEDFYSCSDDPYSAYKSPYINNHSESYGSSYDDSSYKYGETGSSKRHKRYQVGDSNYSKYNSSHYKNNFDNNYHNYTKYSSGYNYNSDRGRGRFKIARGDRTWQWYDSYDDGYCYDYHPKQTYRSDYFYNGGENSSSNVYHKRGSFYRRNNGITGRYRGNRGRGYSNHLSPRGLRQDGYHSKSPSLSPKLYDGGLDERSISHASSTHSHSPCMENGRIENIFEEGISPCPQHSPHYYYEESLSPSESLTVDVEMGVDGSLEECTAMDAFCGFEVLDDSGRVDKVEIEKDLSLSDEKYEPKFEDGHVVHFHINPGTSVNFTCSDGQVQKVSGPATVQMVSSSASPPIALPLHVPPGHFVQQIVDEAGTLQHVILSTQPMSMPVCPYGPPNGNQGPPQYYSPPPPPGPPPSVGPHQHPHYLPPYPPHGQQYNSPVVSPTPITQSSPPPPSATYKNERTMRPVDKFRTTKYYQRHQQAQQQALQQQQQQQHMSQHPIQNSCNYYPQGHNFISSKDYNTNETSPHPPLSPPKDQFSPVHKEDLVENELVNGVDDSTEDPLSILRKLLSNVQPPGVSDVGPYSASLNWDPPDFDSIPPSSPAFSKFCSSDIKYEVFLNNALHAAIPHNHYTISNLRPGMEYKYYLVCTCHSLRGDATPTRSFLTSPTRPDAPNPPRLVEKSKNSFSFRWYAPKDNGSKITQYILEAFGGQYSNWYEVYRNKARQCCISKLKPQTTYEFRLRAVNDIGVSDPGSETTTTTCGLAPARPQAPSLQDSSVSSLTLIWEKRLQDDEFCLQMEDSLDGYGFMPVHNGSETIFACTNLRRNSDYKFRISARNNDGVSPFSDIACYRTLPDKPQPPSSPSLKGNSHARSIRLSWKPPSDHGGSSITSYNAEVDKGSGFEALYTGVNTECDCTNLTPGSLYKFRVQAISAGGPSRWGEEGKIATKAIEPSKCKPPKLLGKAKANVLQLKWVYPEFDGGSPVTEFLVDMKPPANDRHQVYCGKDLECTVASLLPGHGYTFYLCAINHIGQGPWSDPLDVKSGPAPPNAPSAPQLACRGPHVVIVSWEEPVNNGAEVEKYRLQMAEVTNPNTESSEASSTCGESDALAELVFTSSYAGQRPSTEITSLSPATTYAFKVCASNVAGEGPTSALSTVTTPASHPSIVAHITSQPETSEITLHWTEPVCNGDPIMYYVIEFGEHRIQTEVPVLEYVLRDLNPETNYRIRVHAVNSVGSSPPSTIHRVSTKRMPPLPPSIQLCKASFNSLRVKWGDGKNFDLRKYYLEMEFQNPHNHSMEFYQVYNGVHQTFKVGKLEENSTYRLRICASNESGIGPYSPIMEFTTTKAPPLPLKAPRITEGPDSTFCVEWCGVRCPGDDTIVYRLQALQCGKDVDYSLIYTGSETSYVMTGLQPQTGYYIRVCGVRMCAEGEPMVGAYSSPTLLSTPKAPEIEETVEVESDGKERSISWQTLTDSEKTLTILALFSILAALFAYLLSPDPNR